MAFSHPLTGVQWSFSRAYVTCDDVAPLKANGMFACVFLCFKFLSALILNTVNIDRHIPQKLKFFGVCNNF